MSEFIRRVQPERWKVFHVLSAGGQNDGGVDDLLIDAGRFQDFVERHASLGASSVPSQTAKRRGSPAWRG